MDFPEDPVIPCAIISTEEANRLCKVGKEILPGILIAPFQTEEFAKKIAHEGNGSFAWINYLKVVR